MGNTIQIFSLSMRNDLSSWWKRKRKEKKKTINDDKYDWENEYWEE